MDNQRATTPNPSNTDQSLNAQSQSSLLLGVDLSLLNANSLYDGHSFEQQLYENAPGQNAYEQPEALYNTGVQHVPNNLGGDTFLNQNQFSAFVSEQPRQLDSSQFMTVHMENPSMQFLTQPHQAQFGTDFELFSGPNTMPTNNLIDPSLLSGDISANQSNPTLNAIRQMSPHSPHSPHSPFGDQQSPSPHTYSPHSPRDPLRQSLDPSSAAFPQGEWTVMNNNQIGRDAFMQHRRAASDVSEISSTGHSPLLQQNHSFEYHQPSPMLSSQDHTMHELNAIEQFTIGDSSLQGRSPGHTPQLSPRLSPQDLGQNNSPFLLTPNEEQKFVPQTSIYGAAESFPAFQSAPQLVAPAIQVEYAPPSKQPSFGPTGLDDNALSPPMRSGRNRAHSDSSMHNKITRPIQFGSTSPRLDPVDSKGMLSPLHSTARERRGSTNSMPNRDKILQLASPSHNLGANGEPRRVQKHPATFQCTQCPKRFTRAYNLRSHLRTHTNERPFVCTFCDKAFARQHDRKRHESLHSGEKKFCCRGELKDGRQWGCGRRFARADALGRHFRSEAGRICIKPLFDEEAEERRDANLVAQQSQDQMMGLGMQVPQPTFGLPAALIQQFPALATINWDQLAQSSNADDDQRSNFDLSSGNEYQDDDQDGYVSGPGMSYGSNQLGFASADFTSDYEN